MDRSRGQAQAQEAIKVEVERVLFAKPLFLSLRAEIVNWNDRVLIETEVYRCQLFGDLEQRNKPASLSRYLVADWREKGGADRGSHATSAGVAE